MSDAITQARDLLSARLREIEGEERQLRAALEELGGSSTPRRQRSESPIKPSRRRRRKRIPRQEREAALLEAAKTNPEASNKELADAIGLKPGSVSGMLVQLKKQGRLERRGGRLVAS